MSTALVTVTKKHVYRMGRADGGGNKEIVVVGAITMSSETQTTTSVGMDLDLSADIPNLEGCFIQGDGGYVVQYAYNTGSTAPEIEVYGFTVADTEATTAKALAATTESSLSGQVFYFRAWGF